MKLRSLAVAACLAVVLFSACKKNSNNNTSEQDQVFIGQASMSNNAEIQLANLALTKAADASVKNFAQGMITDHTAAQSDLKAVAANLNITVSDSIGAMNMAMMQMLSGLSGHSFDTAYIDGQRTAHQMTIANFQTEISSGSQPLVKAYAAAKLPIIQMHLAMADSIYMRIK